ncbi:hypothetical protein GF412_05550 [Candidatus Micrarchaeota archaeon]|nr:hypothetical protein [Candidatus Micrarchaeota archaeon]MBD3418415.1 hypothetical protein [Candidatus Micrarchaeota archaeon]
MVFGLFSSKLSVGLEKRGREYFPGELVKGHLKLSTLKEVKARGVKVQIRCVEWMNPKKDGGKEEEGKEILLWEKEKTLGKAHKYSAGEWKFEFALPKNALPSIIPEPCKKDANEGAGLKWYIRGHMDIPNGIDMHAYKQFFVY